MNATSPQSDREAPQLHRRRIDQVELAWFEWQPQLLGRAPSLLLAHATGFHGRVWDRMIQHLPPRHILALEQRGHGRSQATPIEHWSVFGRDVAAFGEALGLRQMIGIGHSMGAHALVQAAAIDPSRFRQLILLDPVIASPQAYHLPQPSPDAEHPAARRQPRFASAQAMFERFADRMPYKLFDPQALRDYCEHGLMPAPDGDGMVLACTPKTEASIYLRGRGNPGVYASIRALQMPVLIIRAKLPTPDRNPFDYSFSPTWPDLVGEFRNAREIHLQDLSHFLPMEAPSAIAQCVAEEIARVDAMGS